MFRRILLGLALLIVLAVGAFAIYVASRQHLHFNAPEPQIAASADTLVIARGHYVVRVLGNCAACHGALDQRRAYEEGADVPLSGGFTFKIPPGEFRVRNITPDPETGIGYAYVTSLMGTRLTGDPRDLALRDALYSTLQVS